LSSVFFKIFKKIFYAPHKASINAENGFLFIFPKIMHAAQSLEITGFSQIRQFGGMKKNTFQKARIFDLKSFRKFLFFMFFRLQNPTFDDKKIMWKTHVFPTVVVLSNVENNVDMWIKGVLNVTVILQKICFTCRI